MTKVLDRLRLLSSLAFCLFAVSASGQAFAATGDCPQTTAALYTRLRSVGLDERRVYSVRGATIDRPNLHLAFDDGTIAFSEDVCGRITAAVFEGRGEILVRPPNRVERASLALFTGMAILEEQFTTAYLRFDDDTAAALQPFLSPEPEGSEFAKQRNDTSRTLAGPDALRLLLDFSHFLPTPAGTDPDRKFPRFFHARLQGEKLGNFELYWDAAVAESLWVGQIRLHDGIPYWDVWTSFTPGAPRGVGTSPEAIAGDVAIDKIRIQASVQPPTILRASADVSLLVKKGGRRTLLFELSRFLKVDAVQMNGRALDFLQNEALEGTELRRNGNDLVAVIFPAQLESGQTLELSFRYAGEVLSEAGTGLLYVGERGTWYPNFGLNPAQFNLEFHYPSDWTLVATGKRVSPPASDGAGQQVSRWVSEGAIPVAGFNLGKYLHAEAMAGNVVVQAYATVGVERSFPKAPPELIQPRQDFPGPRAPMPILVAPPPAPSPGRNAQAVADKAAASVETFTKWFGPQPFESLALTQMPGDLSQGWPGLVFLSSYSFLSTQEQADLHLDPVAALLSNQVLLHETAHQWWGDLVLWKTYRDQWLSEGLANYSAMLLLEQRNPSQFRQVLEKYRTDLLSKNKDGEWLRDAGPVTLGQRLISSRFPNGYAAISYERGTWLFHMLRCMLRDAEAVSHSRNGSTSVTEEPFFRALRRVRERYAGKSITTAQLMQVFEEELPRPLWFENRRSLDWFLDGWVNGTSLPRLEMRDVRFTPKDRGVSVAGVITQSNAPDDLVTAVPVYAIFSGNSRTLLGIVLADGAETSFRLTAPAGTRKIALDPRQTILTTLK